MIFLNMERLRHNKMWTILFSFEPLLLHLVLINKFWLKKAKMIKFDRISTFALIHIVLFYLQSRGMLPAMKDMQGQADEPKLSDDFKSPTEKPSLAELFIGFFEFYSKTSENNRIVDVLNGSSDSINQEERQFSKIISFSTRENLSNSMCVALGDVISEAFNRLETNSRLTGSEQNADMKARELMSDLIGRESLVMADYFYVQPSTFATRLRIEQDNRDREVKKEESKNLDKSKMTFAELPVLDLTLNDASNWKPL